MSSVPTALKSHPSTRLTIALEPRAWRAGGEAATGALSRFPLARDCGHQRFGDLGRRLETLDANRHHVEIARPADLAARRRQRRNRHPRRLADATEKEPRDRARFFQGLAHVMDPLRRLFAGAGKLRRRALTARTSAARQCCGQASERIS